VWGGGGMGGGVGGGGGEGAGGVGGGGGGVGGWGGCLVGGGGVGGGGGGWGGGRGGWRVGGGGGGVGGGAAGSGRASEGRHGNHRWDATQIGRGLAEVACRTPGGGLQVRTPPRASMNCRKLAGQRAEAPGIERQGGIRRFVLRGKSSGPSTVSRDACAQTRSIRPGAVDISSASSRDMIQRGSPGLQIVVATLAAVRQRDGLRGKGGPLAGSVLRIRARPRLATQEVEFS